MIDAVAGARSEEAAGAGERDPEASSRQDAARPILGWGARVLRALAAREEPGPARQLDLQLRPDAGSLAGQVARAAARTAWREDLHRSAAGHRRGHPARHVAGHLRPHAPGSGQHRRHHLLVRRLREPGGASRPSSASSASTSRCWVQYVRLARPARRGDLGKSYRYDLPAWEIIKPLLPVTLELAVLALDLSVLLGGAVGRDQRRPAGHARSTTSLRVFTLAGLSCRRSGSAWSSSSLVAWLGWIPPVTYVSPFENSGATPSSSSCPRWRWATAPPPSSCASRAPPCWRCCGRTTSARRGRRARGARVVWRHALKNASCPSSPSSASSSRSSSAGSSSPRRCSICPAWRAIWSRPSSCATTRSSRTWSCSSRWWWCWPTSPWTCSTRARPARRYGQLGRSMAIGATVCRRPRRARGAGAGRRSGSSCRKNPLGAAGGVLMLLILLTAVFAESWRPTIPSHRRRDWCRRARSSGSAPTTSGATSTGASCTAPASR